VLESAARPTHTFRAPPHLGRIAVAILFAAIVVGNAAALVWIWIHNGNLTNFTANSGNVLARLGGITGLLGGYLALVQVLLLARIPSLERLVGFDRLTVWHRWNGHFTIDLIIAHVLLTIWGYSVPRHRSFGAQLWKMLGQGFLPGMVTATIGTFLLVLVVVSSLLIVRRRLRYELWYAVHLSAYAGIALAWFHEIPTGGDLALNDAAADYWRALSAATLALVAWRVLKPVAGALRHRLHVAEVYPESPGVISIRFHGRRLDRLRAQPGQFFLWRFLARGLWGTAHPFSLSEAPDGRSFRITVKAVGGHTRRLATIPAGTRVVAEGPFGAFTAAVRRREKVLLVAGGIGITPIRALLERLEGPIVLVYRVLSDESVVFLAEIDELARRRGFRVEYVVGDHATSEGRELLSPGHLRELVPDLTEREVYLCGPPGMVTAIRRSLLRSGVHRRHLHVERFALSS
jgi:predicted ferric reductase